MKIISWQLAFVVVLGSSGCASESSESLKSGVEAPARQPPADTLAPRQRPASWADQAIISYLAKSSSPLIADARRRGQDLSWITDRTEPTDSATFTVVQIGHDMTEPDGSNPRFSTDGWVYLDTTRRRIYEYDVAEDKLVLWKD